MNWGGKIMIRYTKEQKEAALNRVQEIGVLKTHNEMGISIQTLYKWLADAEGKDAADGRKKMQKNEYQALLDDDVIANKINRLEEENAALIAANLQLKKALLSLLEK